jgi:hypothetical protein
MQMSGDRRTAAMLIEDAVGDWEVEPTDFGGELVRHQHGEVSAICYVYSNPDRVWAECTMCLADLELEVPAS